jgi:hypothetical protein
MLDTGKCVPESMETLLLQQKQLVEGRRPAQMFPKGTPELPLPKGFARFENFRGVFHYDVRKIYAVEIDKLSMAGRENTFLMLGPYSKPEIDMMVANGDRYACVTEMTPEGIELRSAMGTDKTINEQRMYFERTKEPGNIVAVDALPERVTKWLAKG